MEKKERLFNLIRRRLEVAKGTLVKEVKDSIVKEAKVKGRPSYRPSIELWRLQSRNYSYDYKQY